MLQQQKSPNSSGLIQQKFNSHFCRMSIMGSGWLCSTVLGSRQRLNHLAVDNLKHRAFLVFTVGIERAGGSHIANEYFRLKVIRSHVVGQNVS